MARKRKELSDEELAERKRRRCEANRIRRAKQAANETPEAREQRLRRAREWSYTEGARFRYREYRRLHYEKLSQTDKDLWDLWSAHRHRQRRLELWRLQKEANPRKRPARERLMMISQFEKPCSRFQERVESAVVVQVLCGLCQRLCLDSDVQWANEGQCALLARIFPGEDVTLLRLCSKCRRSLSDNKVPLLTRRSLTVGALVTVQNPLKQESTNVDESCRPGSLLGTDNTVLVQVPTNCDDLNRILQPHAEVAAEIFSCCLTKSCSHNTAAALPPDETPKPIEIPGASGAWTQCSVWVSTRPIQAKPKRRTTAVQTEDEALRTGQNSGGTPCE